MYSKSHLNTKDTSCNFNDNLKPSTIIVNMLNFMPLRSEALQPLYKPLEQNRSVNVFIVESFSMHAVIILQEPLKSQCTMHSHHAITHTCMGKGVLPTIHSAQSLRLRYSVVVIVQTAYSTYNAVYELYYVHRFML